MKHVSRKDLYTNLETRVRYLHDFLDFNSSMSSIVLRGQAPKLTESR